MDIVQGAGELLPLRLAHSPAVRRGPAIPVRTPPPVTHHQVRAFIGVLKGIGARDFRTLFFSFINTVKYVGPRFTPWNCFDFGRHFAEIFANFLWICTHVNQDFYFYNTSRCTVLHMLPNAYRVPYLLRRFGFNVVIEMIISFRRRKNILIPRCIPLCKIIPWCMPQHGILFRSVSHNGDSGRLFRSVPIP